MRFLRLPFLALFLGAAAFAETVSLDSLLREMTDRDSLTRMPSPAYTCRQFSSHDRASVSRDTAETDAKFFKPGSAGAKGWFGNKDYDQFIRTEKNKAGRSEQVMLEAEGPGAIVRFWMAGGDHVFDRENKVCVYLDGSDTPVLEKSVDEIAGDDSFAGRPFGFCAPAKTESPVWRGRNLLLPIPYAKRCKITWAGKAALVYYNINYRTYAPSVTIDSFSLEKFAAAKALLADTAARLAESSAPAVTPAEAIVLAPGETAVRTLTGERSVTGIRLALDAADLEQALRSTVLRISFDGEPTVWCPVGQFYGVGHKLRPHKTFFVEVTPSGEMIARWVMPFAKEARVSLVNLGARPVSLKQFAVESSPRAWDARSMYFHTVWHERRDIDTTVREDGRYALIKGKGLYVGDNLTIFNYHPDRRGDNWWGEGDEKVYVDGEKFPSHFGTGTEDYYGYAWCRPQAFSTPFVSQPCGDGNKTPGMTANNRYRLLDAIPFGTGLEFTVEIWHPWGARMNWAPAAFFYALPGATAFPAPDEAAVKLPVGRLPEPK